MAVLAALSLATSIALAGCSAQGPIGSPSQDEPSAPSAESGQAAPATRTIIDALDREVEVPADIERVAIVQLPVLSTYCAYMGGTPDKVVGVSKNIIGAMKGGVLMDQVPELASLSSDCFADGKLNMEELVKLDADVILIPNGNEDLVNALANAGLTAVAFNVNGDPKVLYVEWLRMLEDLFDEPGKMDECIADGERLFAEVEDALANASGQPSALVMYGYQNGAMQVAGSKSRAGFWFSYARAENAAAGIEGINAANMEQVVTWNPDIILLPGPGQCQYLPTDLYGNAIEGADFSTLSAVQNGNVYCCGLGNWSWFTPSADWPLTVQWLAKVLHPDETAGIDVAGNARAYYGKYYGFTPTDAQMDEMFPPYAGI